MRILLVCTGNICRSSMAKVLLKKMFREKFGTKASNFQVDSAGVSAFRGGAAPPEAVELMGKKGLDLSSHRSKPLTKKLVEEADLILTMSFYQKEVIITRIPSARNKIYTLKGFSSRREPKLDNIPRKNNLSQDIEDPLGKGQDAYQRCAQEIEEELRKVVQTIEK